MATYAICRADPVIIPTQGSELDGTEAAKAIRHVRQQEKLINKRIPYSVLFTRTSAALKPRTQRNIQQQFVVNGIHAFETQLHERDAYKALFSFGGTLSTLDPKEVGNLEAARANAKNFAAELIAMLHNLEQPQAEVA